MNSEKIIKAAHIVILMTSVLIGSGCGISGSNGSGEVASFLNWTFLDGNEAKGISFLSTSLIADDTNAAVHNSGIYMVWREASISPATPAQIRVAVYRGGEHKFAWKFVDGASSSGLNKDSTRAGDNPSLTEWNGNLFLTWEETNGTAIQIRVARYNNSDTNPAWTFIDGGGATGINKSVTSSGVNPQLHGFSDRLFACWVEGTGTQRQVRVATYNAHLSVWEFVDGNSESVGLNRNPEKNANTCHLTTFKNKLYLSWREWNSSNVYQLRVALFNGNLGSPSWSFVDGNAAKGLNYAAGSAASDIGLVSTENYLVAYWVEGSPAQLRAAAYDGSTWSFIDGNLPTVGLNASASAAAEKPNMLPLDGAQGDRLIAFWIEGSTRQLRSALFNGSPSSPSWSNLPGNRPDGSLNYASHSAGANAWSPKSVRFNGSTYVVWYEDEATSSSTYVRVARKN